MRNILCAFSIAILIFACQSKSTNELLVYQGEIQGTTFTIKWYGDSSQSQEIQEKIDEVFILVDTTFSGYIDNSLVSAYNRSDTGIKVNQWFVALMKTCIRINGSTNRSFDPTVGPLIKAYGFGAHGFDDSLSLDKITHLKKIVGLHHVDLNEDWVYKDTIGVELDFNGIAQGYTVDLIDNMFVQQGLNSFMIEVGGEIIARGLKEDSTNWAIGIDKPEDNAVERMIAYKLLIKDKAVATSGNYRKFYIKNGRRVNHTISPVTGESVIHSLLSATVLAENCAEADALATSFMVMGLEEAIKFLEVNQQYEALLIYENSEGKLDRFISPSLNAKLRIVN